MSLPVVTVAAGGLPVVDVTAIAPKTGMPVIEAANLRGRAVTKVVGKPGMPVVYEAAAGGGGGGGPGTTTWDPAVKSSHIVLSGSNLIATWDAAASLNSFVRATNPQTSGKWYFKSTFTSATGLGVGITDGTNVPEINNISATHGIVQYFNGSVYLNSAPVLSWPGGNIPDGTVFEIAVDVGNSLIWFKRSDMPALGWNNSSGAADPAAGTGGLSYVASGASGSIYPAALAQGSTTVCTLDFAGGTPPSGFARWGSSAGGGGTGTFDPVVKTTHTVLSGGNLVSTWDATSNGTSWVRVTNSHVSGKWYFRFTLTTLGGGGCGVGLTDGTTLPGVDNPTVIPHAIMQWSNASCYQNSVTVINWITPFPQGAVIEVAVDVDNSRVWFKRSDLPALGWNNSSGAADPAAGTGGVTFTASGTIYPIAMAQTTASVGTLDLAGGTPPAGFGHW